MNSDNLKLIVVDDMILRDAHTRNIYHIRITYSLQQTKTFRAASHIHRPASKIHRAASKIHCAVSQVHRAAQ